MVALAAYVAAAAYLLPVAILVAARVRRGEALVLLSIEIPAVVAIDLLATFLVARVLPLELATWAVRAFWITGACVLAWRWRRRGGKWSEGSVDNAAIAFAAAGACAALMLSLWWSRSYSVWDRAWHVPLASSLRGQRVPFKNVLFQATDLRYHFPGDALGAILQSLSFGVIHADHALAIAHDIMFALTGASAALLLRAVGYRSVWSAVLGATALLLGGPVTILRQEGGRMLTGYSLLNFFTMSFRPHVSLAGLLMVGFLGVIVLRLAPPWSKASVDPRNVVLFSTTALLALTDETSTGMLGIGLGVAWLVAPQVIAPKRRDGLLVLVGLLLAFVGVHLLLGGSLAPGAPLHTMKRTNWRSPGYLLPPLELAGSEDGWQVLLLDMFAIPATWFAFALGWGRLRTHGATGALALLLILGALGFFGLAGLEVNGAPIESHRFATAPLFCAALFSLVWLAKVPPGSLSRIAFWSAAGLPAISTAAWLRLVAPRDLTQYLATQHRQPEMGSVDCRRDTNARFVEKAEPRYVASQLWQLWGGCRPTLTPGLPPQSHWGFPIETSLEGPQALAQVEQHMSAPDEPVTVICPSGGSSDAICSYATSKGLCHSEGSKALACALTPDDRVAILRR
jgi:hypothetical protein